MESQHFSLTMLPRLETGTGNGDRNRSCEREVGIADANEEIEIANTNGKQRETLHGKQRETLHGKEIKIQA